MSRVQEAMTIVRSHPKDAHAWVTLGEALAAEGQTGRAQESFQRALHFDPTNVAAQQGLAGLLGGAAKVVSSPTRPTPEPPPAPVTPPPAAPAALSEPVRPRLSDPEPSSAARTVEAPARDRSLDTAPRGRATAEPTRRRVTAPADDQEGASSGQATSGGSLLRTPPDAPVMPSSARIWAGFVAMGVVAFLCLCVVLMGLASLMP